MRAWISVSGLHIVQAGKPRGREVVLGRRPEAKVPAQRARNLLS